MSAIKEQNKIDWQARNADKKSTFNSSDLRDRAIHRRAVESMIWGMPMVNLRNLKNH